MSAESPQEAWFIGANGANGANSAPIPSSGLRPLLLPLCNGLRCPQFDGHVRHQVPRGRKDRLECLPVSLPNAPAENLGNFHLAGRVKQMLGPRGAGGQLGNRRCGAPDHVATQCSAVVGR